MHKQGLYNCTIYRAAEDVGEHDEKIAIITETCDELEVYAEFRPPHREDAPSSCHPAAGKPRLPLATR